LLVEGQLLVGIQFGFESFASVSTETSDPGRAIVRTTPSTAGTLQASFIEPPGRRNNDSKDDKSDSVSRPGPHDVTTKAEYASSAQRTQPN